MTEFQLRLTWKPASPDKANDFVARAPTYDGTVGRIHKSEGSSGSIWHWDFHAHGPDISLGKGDTDGSEPTPRLAAKRVEDAWHAATKGTVRDFMPLPVNAYAAAKYGA